MAHPENFPINPSRVHTLCLDLGFDLPEEATEGISLYLALLVKWNRVMNLVGPSSAEDILGTLLVDSLHLDCFMKRLPLSPEPESWDLGAGAGLPGVVLRLLWTRGRYVMVEAREKRALFLRSVLAALPLPGVEVYAGRAENFMPGSPPANVVLSRAFMPWQKLLGFVEGRLGPGGCCVFLASEPVPASLPGPWRCLQTYEYQVRSSPRFFWALHRAGADAAGNRVS